MNKLNLTLAISSFSNQPVIDQLKRSQEFLRSNVLADWQNTSVSNVSALKQRGFNLNNMLISCYFNKNQCTLDDFVWSYSYEYGNCYTFNSRVNETSTIKTINNAGTSFGLVLELFAGPQDRLSTIKG
jgi:hypothetical protein